ncbi:hypothetical protein [Catenulispora subtropica]|uniref:ABM domain-containing protein n=1 Tax=Catenulispora subtropica TaxID=450798 RepID=A0ABP5CKG4_9ACTN
MATEQLPATAVIRISQAVFDHAQFPDVREMSLTTSDFLIPAVKELPGLISFYAGVSPEGSVVNVSIWDSEEHAKQLDTLTAMVVDARQAAEKAGATFVRPIINYPIDWTI